MTINCQTSFWKRLSLSDITMILSSKRHPPLLSVSPSVKGMNSLPLILLCEHLRIHIERQYLLGLCWHNHHLKKFALLFIGSKCWRHLIMTFNRIKLIRDVSLPIGVFLQNANIPRNLKDSEVWGSGLGNWEFLKAAFYILLISVSSLILIARICITLASKGVEEVNN